MEEDNFHSLCDGEGCFKCRPVKIGVKCECGGILEIQSHGVSCDTCNSIFEEV